MRTNPCICGGDLGPEKRQQRPSDCCAGSWPGLPKGVFRGGRACKISTVHCTTGRTRIEQRPAVPGLNVTLGRGLYATHLEGWGVAIVTFKLTGKWRAESQNCYPPAGPASEPLLDVAHDAGRRTLADGRQLLIPLKLRVVLRQRRHCGRDFMWTIL